ncbi:4'-phosphopantetheinyl transferase family protein [Kitasatospora sp. NPDC048296]|uniref:4'-phosphopantetheinyl transferase family protein n=1 Tax=Kitasatospora sp. NPDC048296 TaxID=3364048 RepID=UPI00371A1FBF
MTDDRGASGVREEDGVTRRAIRSDAVDLWLLPEHAVAAFAAERGGPALLTEEERARHERLCTAGARRRYLGARLLCRHALSARTGRPPDGWRFRLGEFGRPEPEPECEGVRFNLSHTDGLIACVVTQDRACGVDVERAPADPESAGHLSRHFAAAERAELAALEPAARHARLSELWVLKESYLKALGTGMTRGLGGFRFRGPAAGRITVEDFEQPAGAGDRWWFDLLHPGPEHVLAVAVEHGRPGALRRTELSPIPIGL